MVPPFCLLAGNPGSSITSTLSFQRKLAFGEGAALRWRLWGQMRLPATLGLAARLVRQLSQKSHVFLLETDSYSKIDMLGGPVSPK